LRLQPVPDAGHGTARDQPGRHLPLHLALRARHDRRAGPGDGLPADRALAAGERLAPLNARCGKRRRRQYRCATVRRMAQRRRPPQAEAALGETNWRTRTEQEAGGMSKTAKMNKRQFLKTAGLATTSAVAAGTIGAPYVKSQGTIRWRLQTYAGPALAEHVI